MGKGNGVDVRLELEHRLKGEVTRLRNMYNADTDKPDTYGEVNEACRILRTGLISSMRKLLNSSAQTNELAEQKDVSNHEVDARAYMILKASKILVVEEVDGASRTFVDANRAAEALMALEKIAEVGKNPRAL